jgi:UDP-2,4-diacetamido-2,4,6-trideoxy-beta-L-altropyranose hydrolase
MPRVVIRADSSDIIGSGHIQRCLVIARGLRKKGWDVSFICRDFKNSLISVIQENKFPVHILNVQKEHDHHLEHSQWLGATQEKDAEETLTFLKDSRLLIVDHYGIDKKWEIAIRKNFGGKILVIDDLANRKHDCDYLVDTNYRENAKLEYEKILSIGCKCFFGPSYAILNEKIRELAAITSKEFDVFIYFGSMDLHRSTVKALENYNTKLSLKIVALTSENAPSCSEIEKLCKEKGLIFSKSSSHYAELLASSKICLGAGGVSLWERFFLGIPNFVAAVATNQLPACMALSQKNYIRFIGNSWEMSPLDWQNTWNEVSVAIKEKNPELSNTIKNLSHPSHKIEDLIEKELTVE